MPLVFTRAWEDDQLDLEALRPGPGDRVLVVAAAGDAALALAATGADVVAVDRDADQLRLLALKLAAIPVLDGGELHRWFEAGRSPGAGLLYRERVRDRLAPGDRTFWDERIGLLTRGMHAAVGPSRAFGQLGRIARLLVPGLAARLEEVPDADAQGRFWEDRMRPRLFGPLTHALMRWTPLLAPLAPNPHELRRMRGSGWSHGLEARIGAVAGSVLVREHPWWRPALTGRPVDPGFGAAWLRPARLAALGAWGSGPSPIAAGRVTPLHADLTEALLAVEPGSLAAVSVSNVPDWLMDGDEAALAAAVRRALRSGGRVIVRRVVRREAPDAFAAAGLVPDPDGSDLAARDRTALYESVALLRAP